MKPSRLSPEQNALRIVWSHFSIQVVALMRRNNIIKSAREHLCRDCNKPAVLWEHRDYSYPSKIDAVCNGCNQRRGNAIYPNYFPIASPGRWAKRFLWPKKKRETSIKLRRLRANGRLGGLKGGPARRDSLTPERRIEISRAAAAARWKGHKKTRWFRPGRVDRRARRRFTRPVSF